MSNKLLKLLAVATTFKKKKNKKATKMAMDKSKVKILNSFVAKSYEDIFDKAIDHFLSFCKKSEIVKRSNDARLAVESSMTKKNFEFKMNDVRLIPEVASYYEIDRNTMEVFGEVKEETRGTTLKFVESVLMKEEGKPPHYVIVLNNDMIDGGLNDSDKSSKNSTHDFLKQVSRSRIFEKLDEKYNSDKYFLFIFSDSIKKTELEQLIANEGSSFKEKNLHASLRLFPNSSRNYTKVDSPIAKKNWLRSVKNLQESMYIPNCLDSVHFDITVHAFTNGTSNHSSPSSFFISTPTNVVSKIEKKKVIKKRKADTESPSLSKTKENKSKESKSVKNKEIKQHIAVEQQHQTDINS